MPDLSGRTVLVTGANTGIGFETARCLAVAGATVILACRDVARGSTAADRIRQVAPGAVLSVQPLDLASLGSVRAAAARVRSEHPRLDLLVANAGVMTPPRGRTEDGFELHIGINHLGHFALVGLLLDRLLAAPGSRVVVVSSVSSRWVRGLDVGDLHSERRYVGMLVYGRSKLANLLFAQELHHRLTAAGAATVAVAAHPGGSPTEVTRYNPVLRRMHGSGVLASRLSHPPQLAALPVLRAAVDPAVTGGEFYGPAGPLGLTGHPDRAAVTTRALDRGLQRRLWTESERLTGVAYLS